MKFAAIAASVLILAPVAAPLGRAEAARCPNVILVLDRSGSMVETPDGVYPAPAGQSKWEVLEKAVQNVLGSYGDRLPFGLQMYASSGFDDAQCYSDARIDVEPAHKTAASILQKVLAAKPDGGTNTGEAIKRVANDPVMLDPSRRNYVILITDGDPNCNSGESARAAYTTSVLEGAATVGVQTFVVGFDGTTGVKPANLNSMALAGGQPKPGCNGTTANCYYSAQDAQSLNDALTAITTIITGGGIGETCDDSCVTSGCDSGFICTTDASDPAPHCVADPCGPVTCADGAFCRGGTCVEACTTPCRSTEKCQDGHCVTDPCQITTCGSGLVCHPITGQCVADACGNVTCTVPLSCDRADGKCKSDPCSLVKCPSDTVCVGGGNCAAVASDNSDGGMADGALSDGGHANNPKVGCTVGHGSAAHEWVIGVPWLVAFVRLGRRRRRRHRGSQRTAPANTPRE